MPIWLRKYTFNSIKEYYDKESEEHDKQMKKLTNTSNSLTIAKPPVPTKPTYSTKAPKK